MIGLNTSSTLGIQVHIFRIYNNIKRDVQEMNFKITNSKLLSQIDQISN